MIGIFDSGIGGLTAVKEIFKELPGFQIIYFGDNARLPYGTKGENLILRWSKEISQWLIKKGAKIIIIACHTSSAWAGEELKKKFKIPVFEIITPALKKALSLTKNKKIGVIGTPGTIKSQIYQKKILKLDRNIKIYSKPCPLFVPLVEEGWLEKKETKEIAKNYLKSISKKIDALILGCTHYPLLKKTIKEIVGPNIKIINPAQALVKDLKLFLERNPKISSQIKKGKGHQFFFSDKPYNLEKISKLCLGKKIKIKIVDPINLSSQRRGNRS